MLPATLAQDVKKQLRHYLEATFPMRRSELEQALAQFFNDPEKGLFKGPWLQLRRPFRVASDNFDHFFDLPVPFTPFKHQFEAWRRLTSKENTPKPTLITTGTGSGKTECFLYPLLDHCWREHQAGRKAGIKAIVLYPMNALAADQAGRFAEEILKSDLLSYETTLKGESVRKAHIRVGLYTGRMQPGREDKAEDKVGADDKTWREVQIVPPVVPGGKPSYVAITNRSMMQDEPPDILLTNYKMLDYLLMRPKDQGIWLTNDNNPGLLRYLVLDELHTYDGAQGADVACLIRRLKERLKIPKGELCVVGTSATIAGGDETQQDPINRLCGFAESLFEERIPSDAVIEEDRFHIHEVALKAIDDESVPDADSCQPLSKEEAPAYARRMAPLFAGPTFPLADDDAWLRALCDRTGLGDADLARVNPETRWALALGEWLRVQPLFHGLLRQTEHGVVRWDELLRLLSREDYVFQAVGDLEQRGRVLMAFLALVAQARELRSGRPFPLAPTQVQLWLRELRRIGLIVGAAPRFNWLDEPIPNRKQLPAVHCTECGEVAWVGLRDPDRDAEVQQHVQGFALDDDVQKIYQGWGFEHLPSDRLVIFSPWVEGDDPLQKDGGDQLELEGTRHFLAPTSLVLRVGPGSCPLTGEASFAVKVSHERRQRERDGQWYGLRNCPHCQAEDSLMFIGSRAATVASVSIDEVFGSTLNSDAKLLAFTDSVQDASHRAGFFSARTYHFTFRTALQHVIDEAGDTGLPMTEVGERLLTYWSEAEPGRPGSLREVMATLIPPDLREYAPYLEFRDNPTRTMPGPALKAALIERLNWEAASEFSLMQTHGRTMEAQASAALGWDDDTIARTIELLRARLPAVSPALEGIDDESFILWLLGILHRARLRGALYHPYLDAYARQGFWGKYPFGRTVAGRETYPPAGRYKPRLMVTERDKKHEHLLAPSTPGSNPPWQLIWARRVLGVPSVDDNTLLDLLDELLKVGEQAGILHRVHSDGQKDYYALNADAASLYGQGQKLLSPKSGESLFRPTQEASRWQGAPSMGYRDEHGYYEYAALNERETYYGSRYRKGALRRVFAFEHTGLLSTEEREALEMQFHAGGHADDPNVLTATSTLEMGIDIGDLSTTMLCSIPPTVASFLQRIGRAGRSTGTALILSVINQRPHDLFFFARPQDLLNGEVEPPGCWLDATAVIVRQYLAFCFDSAVAAGVLTDLPATGKQLIDEVLVNQVGHIPDLIAWMTANEAELQGRFMARFSHDFVAGSDTPDEFIKDSRSEKLQQDIKEAAIEFNLQRQLLSNARNRLNDQKKKLDPKLDQDALMEIEREQKILSARTRKLGEISALEVLTEHGLLPNYAFPERGVRFSGTTYNQHADNQIPGAPKVAKEERLKNYEIVRGGSAAIRELAPANHFYTHSHVFDIQQLEIGSKSQPLIEEWAVCGECGHMRTRDEVIRPDSVPACPQCGYDGIDGQTDQGQHHACLPFHRSQSVSYMEYYESLSGDKGEERESEPYRMAVSFDHTLARASGAVGDDSEPFGIEYRSAVKMRELNTGYFEQPPAIPFGQGNRVPEGFEVCNGCGVAVMPGETRADVQHRKSCPGRRLTEALHREGQQGNAYQWERTWLYRELRSEAIRLLLPDVDEADLDTLEAAIYLGMRLRFQGDPAHLMVKPQIIPDHRVGVTRSYLVLMDAVPGGTGFLKALYQERDEQQRPGEGVVDILRRARNALETCACRRLHQTDDDTDGCYRCIRTYHMQHRAQNISRERGIVLLDRLLQASANRSIKSAIDAIKVEALFGSVLEKRFVDRLRDWVEAQHGQWLEALINGKRGFRFVMGSPERGWELELQPQLASAQGVSVACQPDFMLRCDDAEVRPIAIFTDGLEFHVEPEKPESRLADDVNKRRAILESGRFHVWSITWNDLSDKGDESELTFLHPPVVENVLIKNTKKKLLEQGRPVPNIALLSSDPWSQLQAFILCPDRAAWSLLAESAAGVFMTTFAMQGKGVTLEKLQSALDVWRSGYAPAPVGEESGDWLWLSRISLSEDMLAYALGEELTVAQYDRLRIALRLEDAYEERQKSATYPLRWRRFLAMLNFFQFASNLVVFTTSEVSNGTAPELPLDIAAGINAEWQAILEDASSSLDSLIRSMAVADRMPPEVAYEDDDIAADALAELAWSHSSQRIVLLVGDQAHIRKKWSDAGWRVFTDADVITLGEKAFIAELPARNDMKQEEP
jgi:DEAD/DEAH box helicase domain-containing protein